MDSVSLKGNVSLSYTAKSVVKISTCDNQSLVKLILRFTYVLCNTRQLGYFSWRLFCVSIFVFWFHNYSCKVFCMNTLRYYINER